MRATATALALAALIPAAAAAETIEGTLDEGELPAIAPAADGEFEGRFRDVHEFAAEGDQAVTLDLRADFDCYLALVGPEGDVIAANDDMEVNSHSRLEDALLPTRGTYQVVVTSFSPGTTGTYTLEIGELGPPPGPAPDVSLAIPGTVAGGLRSDDDAAIPDSHSRAGENFHRDGYTLTGGEPGTTWEAILEADFDAYLVVVGPDGNVLAENDDDTTMFNARVRIPWTEQGTHRVIVTSYQRRTNGDYTLTVQPSH
jgi:hypothetical protein